MKELTLHNRAIYLTSDNVDSKCCHFGKLVTTTISDFEFYVFFMLFVTDIFCHSIIRKYGHSFLMILSTISATNICKHADCISQPKLLIFYQNLGNFLHKYYISSIFKVIVILAGVSDAKPWSYKYSD